MLNGAKNIVINGGLFVENAADGSRSASLDQLISDVAPNSILNADGRADDVRCYPGTREEVIDKTENWMNGESSHRARMMWLSGPAGAGKSAICQTLAERCREHGRYSANFFFFRGDGTRNHARPLVATLIYQLLDFYPALRERLTEILTMKPLIYRASIEEQFSHLISSPMKTLQNSSCVRSPIILVIDGLDECDDIRKQEQIINTLHVLVEDKGTPFRVLIASRAEHHLVMAFNQIATSVESIFLDSQYRPQDDIRRFVVGKFDDIKRVHSLAYTLEQDWPTDVDIDAIAGKSSGQFIYAATVMRFIQYAAASPALSLLTVCRMQPCTSHNPFAQLDAVYAHILSKSHDIQAVKLILGARFVASLEHISLPALLQLLGYKMIEVQSLLADLVAIIKVNVESATYFSLLFYHASLTDYLKDKSRSGIYYVNTIEITAELSSICLRNFYDSASLSLTCSILGYVEESTETLYNSLLHAPTRRLQESIEDVTSWGHVIVTIDKLYLKTDKATFRLLLRRWVRFAYIHNIRMGIDGGWLSTTASMYYKLYRVTERVKLAFRLNK